MPKTRHNRTKPKGGQRVEPARREKGFAFAKGVSLKAKKSAKARREDLRKNQKRGAPKMKKYLYWSGGKDSSASIVLCHEKGIHLDGIVMCEVMFDHSRNISGENPEHIKWVYEVAIPIIENVFGYKVIILKDKSDYIQEFYHKITKSKKEDKVGKYTGFFIGGMCVGNRDLKMRPIKEFEKEIGKHIHIIGIAADEPERLARLSKNKKSVLAEFNITENMTYDICKTYKLLSPIYKNRRRGGCWFCPNQSYKEFAELKKNYPHLWKELKLLSNSNNLASQRFKYCETFNQVEKKVDLINSQITIFDFINKKNLKTT